MYNVHVSLTNETEGHIFSEFTETANDYYETPGELYRAFQQEYGRCRSKVYVDTDTGAKPIGWYFESRQRYEDTNEPYLRGAWITYAPVEEEESIA